MSMIRGTPCACAVFAKSSISNTVNAGLAIVSPNISFVFGRNAAFNSSSVASGDTKVAVIPILASVTAMRLKVPP